MTGSQYVFERWIHCRRRMWFLMSVSKPRLINWCRWYHCRWLLSSALRLSAINWAIRQISSISSKQLVSHSNVHYLCVRYELRGTWTRRGNTWWSCVSPCTWVPAPACEHARAACYASVECTPDNNHTVSSTLIASHCHNCTSTNDLESFSRSF